MFLFYTDLLKRQVMDRHGRFLGYPFDFTLLFQEAYPRLTGMILRRGWWWNPKYYFIPWVEVQLVNHHFQLRLPLESLQSEANGPEGHVTVRQDILDQQVLDTYNRRVVRVNDVHFLQVHNEMRLAHVDVGLRGMVRRLGWEKVLDFVVGLINRDTDYLTHEALIAWKYVQPLPTSPMKGAIQLNVPQNELRSIPPADLGQILTELDPHPREALFKALDRATQAGIFVELESKMQLDLLQDLDSRVALELMDRLPTDEAADLLSAMNRRDSDRLLMQMDNKRAQTLSGLLEHRSDSAGGLMTTEMTLLPEGITVAEAIERVKATTGKSETIYDACIIDDKNHLQGMVTLRTLLISDPLKPISEVMTQKPVHVHVNASAKEVAYVIDKYNFLAVPVVDDDNIIQGIITIDDVLSMVIEATWGDKTGLL
jgi:CBS domain-containing protein